MTIFLLRFLVCQLFWPDLYINDQKRKIHFCNITFQGDKYLFSLHHRNISLRGQPFCRLGGLIFVFNPIIHLELFLIGVCACMIFFSPSTLYDFFVVWVGWKSRLSVLNQTTMEMWNNLWTSDGNFLRVFDWPWNSAHWYFNAG